MAIQIINDTEFIGESLSKINNNFSSLSTQVTALSSTLQNNISSISNTVIGYDRLNANVAGDGLGGGYTEPLKVNVDGVTLGINNYNELYVNTTNIIPNDVLNYNRLSTNIAGSGLSGLYSQPLNVLIDNSTIKLSANNSLYVNVPSLAGNGLSANDTTITINTDNTSIQIVDDTLSVMFPTISASNASTSPAQYFVSASFGAAGTTYGTIEFAAQPTFVTAWTNRSSMGAGTQELLVHALMHTTRTSVSASGLVAGHIKLGSGSTSETNWFLPLTFVIPKNYYWCLKYASTTASPGTVETKYVKTVLGN